MQRFLRPPCGRDVLPFVVFLWVAAGALQAHAAPRLVLVLAVDQLRNDRVSADLPGGLGRLVREGYRFERSSVAHGVTETCPGHAVIVTGTHPARSGIPGNTYLDRDAWQRRYCVEDDDAGARVLGNDAGRSPRTLRAPALGDWLKSESPESRVYAVSGKDRAAIMMGGQGADGVFWFSPEQRAFTSSRFYMDVLPEYVGAFNASQRAALPRRWEHGPGKYREDDYPGEAEDNRRVSGHPVASGRNAGRQILQSPFIDRLTLGLARELVSQEALGRGRVLDVLTVSLSAMDTVGHLYGPFSAEAEDTLARLDAELAGFLDFLDSEIGAGEYAVALTSDHGVTPLPEYAIALGESHCPVPGGRISYFQIALRVYGRLYWRFTAPFDLPTSLVRMAGSQVYVNGDYARGRGLDPDAVVAEVARILGSVPGVRKAWTRAEISAGGSEEARLLGRSLVPDRGGDLLVQLEPGCVLGSEGTGHGMLYADDRAVPLVFYGAGIAPGRSHRPAYSVDVAPTLARLLGIPAPAGLDGEALELPAAEAQTGSGKP